MSPQEQAEPSEDLPITNILKRKIEVLIREEAKVIGERGASVYAKARIHINSMIPEVRRTELEALSKAKVLGREEAVKVLNDIKNEYRDDCEQSAFEDGMNFAIKFAIERIKFTS